ncbi:MAG: hypothetical protein HC780_09270 [Leptolyngbyaceae cyanobacterium CSU_1_3]|nr:hypothetical protein [Leptolyngbyaceae cyanobacterium CSU_1_3]
MGDKIDPAKAALVNDPSDPTQFESVGLDGYWERRARVEGMRVLVGERLELGNVNTWVTPRDLSGNGVIEPPDSSANPPIPLDQREREGDPLIPPNVAPYPVSTAVTHVDLQRRTLRDNLSAVQATAVYHSDRTANGSNLDYPIACLASTAHPGTLTTLRQSVNFIPTQFASGATGAATTVGDENSLLMTDFFTGRGTNGWEFSPPGEDASKFANAMGGCKQPFKNCADKFGKLWGRPRWGLSTQGRQRKYPSLPSPHHVGQLF